MSTPEQQRELFFNDVTLRDGEQAPGNTMTEDEKIAIAQQLVRMGIPGIEAGFPIASRGDFRAVERIAHEVGPMRLPSATSGSPHPRISGLARLDGRDIDAALRAARGAPHRGIHTFISTSRAQLVKFADALRKRGADPESMRDFLEQIVFPGIEEYFAVIRETDPDAVIQFSPEDWTRTDEAVSDDVVLAAAENGANVINLPDTVGIGIPRVIGERVAHVRALLDQRGFRDVAISWHGHNDTGQGVACSMEALYGGAQQLETTVLGIGERTGNFSFESTLAALDANRAEHERMIGMPIRDTLVRGEVMRTAQLVASTIGVRIPRESPIVGENAFAHESGIHQQGVLAGRNAGNGQVYEILSPETYGAMSKIILGKHSGWAGMRDFLQQHRLPFREQDRAAFVSALSTAADERRKGLSDAEVLEQVYYPTVIQITRGPYVKDVHPNRTVAGEPKSVMVSCGHEDACYGLVGRATAKDEGALDAFMQVLKKQIPDVEVKEFSVRNKPGEEGASATAIATVVLRNGFEVMGMAEHHDTEQAGLLAVQRAFNALCARERYARMVRDSSDAA
ncbi:MAG: hypothetical protein PHU04_04190 [Candidatus Peribacteraceae bacterium]|nr:hypothetical protein [Candidatus Peribacteraceae bacterium]